MRSPTPRLPAARRQRGAALLTAMIIVTLVATLAAAMVWQQWRAVQVESAERARVQSAWILSGALDFAKLVLKETVKLNKPTTLGDPWATPLAEARLSTFLAVDKSNVDDGPEAFLSGYITDAQSRYNLTNLLSDTAAAHPELDTLRRLCQVVGIETGVADRIATGLKQAAAVTQGTSSAAPLNPQRIEQLSWLGIEPASIQALQPFVVLLDVASPVNVNTAPSEVLQAVVNGLNPGTAEQLVQLRKRTPFADTSSFLTQAGQATTSPSPNIGISSSYFDVRGRLRLVDRVLVEHSLVHMVNGQVSVVWHERIASLEQTGG